MPLTPFEQFPAASLAGIETVLAYIDDTLTVAGRMPAVVFEAMERLRERGLRVVPVTGRPAGWCDHIARMWPVEAVVGENGAFYFRYDAAARRMQRRYWQTEAQRRQDRRRLDRIRDRVLATVPECRVAADQAYREADLAIDFAEDTGPLPAASVEAIVKCFTASGARAKISSIHVNGWYGDYDKLAMTRRLFRECFGADLDARRDRVIYIGDSPNDAPMFDYFPHSVGVANVRQWGDVLRPPPRWVTRAEGGLGFAEMVAGLLAARTTQGPPRPS